MGYREELEAMEQERLDDLVYEAKADEASTTYQTGASGDIYEIKSNEAAELNNQGREAQIEFLLEAVNPGLL